MSERGEGRESEREREQALREGEREEGEKGEEREERKEH